MGAKQTTLIILNSSLDILNQLQACQGSAPSTLATVQSDIKTLTDQIAQIQSDIIALQLKQNEIKAVTDLTKIPALYAQVTSVVNPAATYSLALRPRTKPAKNNKPSFFINNN